MKSDEVAEGFLVVVAFDFKANNPHPQTSSQMAER